MDETIKGKIDAALQKPTGLTKTKLVGVGTSGQENIEIGDNLTLANGKLSASGGGGGGTHAWETIKYIYPRIAAKEYTIGEQIDMGDRAKVNLDGSELSVMTEYPAIFSVDGVVFTWTIALDTDFPTRKVHAYVYCIKPGTVTHANNYTLKIVANKQK